ncbi:MAG: hypothetical protein MR215_03845 [Bacteroidales bacterium]|nr:hypothetical protein [Bacteroidales bacterium]MDD7725546.1 hypothetical protein [Bacteroidales bacterium]MDY4174952.1 hypothetical protein [Bacteroidales bacterium]
MKRIVLLFMLLLSVLYTKASEQQDTLQNKLLIAYEIHKADWVNIDAMSSTKGISACYMRNYVVGPRYCLAVEYGAKVTWLHGVKKSGAYDAYTDRVDYLNVSLPVNLTRSISIGTSGVSLAPFFGPNFKFNIVGKYRESFDGKKRDSVNYLSRDRKTPASIFQFGMNVGVGFYYKQFVVAYTFQPDFTDYVKDDMECCKHTNTNSFSVGVRF